MRPTVHEIGGGNREQIQLKQRARECWIEAAGQEQKCATANKEERGNQQRFVTQAAQPPSQPCGHGRCSQRRLIVQTGGLNSCYWTLPSLAASPLVSGFTASDC